jgi:hypothetical protein
MQLLRFFLFEKKKDFLAEIFAKIMQKIKIAQIGND